MKTEAREIAHFVYKDYAMPCPFCGEKPMRTDRDGEWAHWRTGTCVLDGFKFCNLKSWNTRMIHYRPNNLRGQRAKANIVEDHVCDIPDEVLYEVLAAFSKGEKR